MDDIWYNGICLSKISKLGFTDAFVKRTTTNFKTELKTENKKKREKN